jgi:serine protein kinase
MGLLENIKKRHSHKNEEYTIEEYLNLCKEDSSAYASAAERLLKAIGEPKLIDTKNDPRLGRIFSNKTIKIYPSFENDFFGMEETIDEIVRFFKNAAQGMEEKKQILYLMGPVGGGKSSLAEKIKALAQQEPIYVLKYEDEMSPVHESPLGLFSEAIEDLEEEYNIPKRYVPVCMSPWARKRLNECGGDVTKFKVVKVYPSIQDQIAISKTEPGDENNQDISTLVGKTDISKMGLYAPNDADSYSYTGGLCLGNQGVMEFVEMFKAPIKVLHPLLTATQERNYKGTQPIGAIPFDGIILAHSNESEWDKFVNDKKNEAFIDRLLKIQVPYCLRESEEVKIYKKMLDSSSLSEAPCAPKTLELLAQFSVLARMEEPEHSTRWSKMKVYDGESLKKIDPNAKSLQEYKEVAGINEGMSGTSTRFAFKVLSKTFNYDKDEIAANPVHLLKVLTDEVIRQQYPQEKEDNYIDIIRTDLTHKYADYIENEINKAYVESYSELGQNIFDKYYTYADHWMRDEDFKDPETGLMYTRESLNEELEKIEKPAGIGPNAKDFRQEVVNYILRTKAENEGKMPKWDSYGKLKEVIEKRLFAASEEVMPVISFGPKQNKDSEKKHAEFLKRMTDRGYTEKQVKILVEWYNRHKTNN